MTRHASAFALTLLALAAGACTIDETPAPPLTGPSAFALSLALAAQPDMIRQDGASQSIVTIEARGPEGLPARNVALRVDTSVNGVIQDFGTLATHAVTTDVDGRARVTYTSPPRSAGPADTGTLVTIVVTPMGTDARAHLTRQVDIRVIPPGVILPPNGTPVPAFTVSPNPAATFTPIRFDASTTTDEGVACGGRCAYSWSFGDGGSANGMTVTHEFRTTGTFTVQLTVRDQRGQLASRAADISVGPSATPVAGFVFSPTEPTPGQLIFFDASASTAAQGRHIVSYHWNFGSGRTGEGMTVSKGYDTAGTYTVTLNVTDDAGQVGTTSNTVPVGVSPPPTQP